MFQQADPFHEKLVEIGGRDSQKIQAFEQRIPFVSGFIQNAVVECQPAEFPVSGVIAGWTEALQLMPVGAKYRLYIPHNLAYGERGAGDAIKPYSALIFDVELLDIL